MPRSTKNSRRRAASPSLSPTPASSFVIPSATHVSEDSGLSSATNPPPSKKGRSLEVSDMAEIMSSFAASLASSLTTNLQMAAIGASSRPKASADAVPKFDPSDKKGPTAKRWLEQLEQLRAANLWSEAMTIHFMQARLAGSACTWYNNLESLNHSWEEWKVMIERAFPSKIDYAELLSEMLGRQKQSTESYITYYYDKMALLHRLKITGENAVSCVIHGIPNNLIRTGARGGQYTEPTDLLNYLTSVGSAIDSTGQKSDKKPSGDKPSGAQPKKPTIKCYTCGELGHLSRDCCRLSEQPTYGTTSGPKGQSDQKDAKNRASLNTSNVECFKCGKKGHYSRQCPNLAGTSGNKTETI